MHPHPIPQHPSIAHTMPTKPITAGDVQDGLLTTFIAWGMGLLPIAIRARCRAWGKVTDGPRCRATKKAEDKDPPPYVMQRFN